METSPYAPPVSTAAPEISSTLDAEAIRREHIKHEASVKSLGSLYYIGFAISLLMAIGVACSLLLGKSNGEAGQSWGAFAGWSVFSMIQFLVGKGLRGLKRDARGVAGIFAAIGVIGFPVGTLISAYLLYLLFSQKGAMVFSPAYKQVIAETPHIRNKTSVVVWVLLGIVLLLFLAAAVWVVILGSK